MEEKEYKFTTIDSFIKAMYQLSPYSNPGKYIADYANLERIKEDVVNKFFDLFVAVNKKCPHISISAEGRIKTYPSYLEKVYKKEKQNVENNTHEEPIIYDMSAFRLIVVSITHSLEQVTSLPNKKTNKLEYFYRITEQDKKDTTQKLSKIKKINVGDMIHIDANTSIRVTEDNLVTNSDGIPCIKNELGDLFTLNRRKIEKDDRASTMNAVYELRNAIEEYTKETGFQYIPLRDKDKIAHPKTKRESHVFKSTKYTKEFLIDLLTELEKINFSLVDKKFTKRIIDEIQEQNSIQDDFTQMKTERLKFLTKHPDKRVYKRAYLPEYQSYHLGYYDPTNGYPFEIQLRSLHMHRVAEHNALIGHNSYKELKIDDSAPLRVPYTFVFKKSYQENGEPLFEKSYIEDDILYKKMYGKTKEEVFAEIARNKLPKISLAKSPESQPKPVEEDLEL